MESFARMEGGAKGLGETSLWGMNLGGHVGNFDGVGVMEGKRLDACERKILGCRERGSSVTDSSSRGSLPLPPCPLCSLGRFHGWLNADFEQDQSTGRMSFASSSSIMIEKNLVAHPCRGILRYTSSKSNPPEPTPPPPLHHRSQNLPRFAPEIRACAGWICPS